MSGPRARRLSAAVVGLAVGLAIPVPARAAITDPPSARWSVPVDGPSAVATDADGVVAVTNLGDVVALGPRGATEWRAQVAEAPAAPAIAGDAVVVGDREALHAFDRADGTHRWSRPLPAPAHHVAAGAGVAVVADLDGGVFAFDLVDGAPRWELRAVRAVYHEPVVDTTRGAVLLVVPDAGGNRLRVLDAATGALRWEYPVDGYTAIPVVADDRVVVAEGDGRFHAVVLSIDAATGTRQWASQVPASFESGIEPAVIGRRVLVVDHYGTVTALDRDTGHLRWERRLGQTVLATRIAAAGSRVVMTTAAMEVVVLAQANGRVTRRVGADSLVGFAVDVRPAPFGRGTGVVAALRLGPRERIELWPSP